MGTLRHLWLATLAMTLTAAGTAWGQVTNTNALPPLVLPLPLPATLEVTEPPDTLRLPAPPVASLESPPPLSESGVRFGGLIGDATQLEQPLQLLNPLAPPEYGDGTRNLSVHPTTGRVEGVTLFSLRFSSLFKPKPAVAKPKPVKTRPVKTPSPAR